MLLPLVHHPDYDAQFNASHRFPMGKYAALHGELYRSGVLKRSQVFRPAPAPRNWLTLAHADHYVDQVISCAVPGPVEKEIGFAINERVSLRAQLASAGTVIAARLALHHGLACNMAGGSHHARRERGAGFCVFNDVGVAASVLLADGAVNLVHVIDLDVHQGDGTALLFADEPRVVTASLHCAGNYPHPKACSDLDVALPAGTKGDVYLPTLDNLLAELRDGTPPDLVFYNAGVDVHQADRLGKFALDDDDIRARDAMVFSHFRESGIPVCAVIGGGYDHDVVALAKRHAILFETALAFC
jgi:acetoin utilization deacetylase AcuC-like enzyme